MKVSVLLQLLVRKKSLFLSRIMDCHAVPTEKTPRKRGFITPQCHQKEIRRRDARVAEEARLESVYTSKAYPGFESPSLRKEEWG